MLLLLLVMILFVIIVIAVLLLSALSLFCMSSNLRSCSGLHADMQTCCQLLLGATAVVLLHGHNVILQLSASVLSNLSMYSLFCCRPGQGDEVFEAGPGRAAAIQ